MSTTATVSILPACQAKEGCKDKGRIDCRSFDGRWGYTCLTHWATFAMTPGRLGTGIGQYLLLPNETTANIPPGIPV